MKKLLVAVLVLSSVPVSAQQKPYTLHHIEYHVSVKGDDYNRGSLSQPFKTISAAANVAMPAM
jgi:alpha-N-arabinofuranosidase